MFSGGAAYLLDKPFTQTNHHVMTPEKATKQLVGLLNLAPFDLLYQAMELILNGADPNVKNSDGDGILHVFVKQYPLGTNFCFDHLQTIIQRGANIHLLNKNDQTALQNLLAIKFLRNEVVVSFLRLGANPYTKDENGQTVLDRLKENNKNSDNDSYIDETFKIMMAYKEKNFYPARNHLLNFLIIAATSETYFKYLPQEIISNIIIFLDFANMNKNPAEGIALAAAVFEQKEKIQKMAKMPGGINVYQDNDPQNNQPIFTFFKSAKTLCKDFENLKSKIDSQHKTNHPYLHSVLNYANDQLNELETIKKSAIPFWEMHSALYQLPASKKILLDQIKDSKLYTGLKSQLK